MHRQRLELRQRAVAQRVRQAAEGLRHDALGLDVALEAAEEVDDLPGPPRRRRQAGEVQERLGRLDRERHLARAAQAQPDGGLPEHVPGLVAVGRVLRDLALLDDREEGHGVVEELGHAGVVHDVLDEEVVEDGRDERRPDAAVQGPRVRDDRGALGRAAVARARAFVVFCFVDRHCLFADGVGGLLCCSSLFWQQSEVLFAFDLGYGGDSTFLAGCSQADIGLRKSLQAPINCLRSMNRRLRLRRLQYLRMKHTCNLAERARAKMSSSTATPGLVRHSRLP